MSEITNGARCATLQQLRELFKLHLGHTPCDLTIRTRLDEWKVPRFKANPAAKKGGGPCYYSVAHVEKQLRSRMLPGRLVAL
ncbi:MAG TPA: hypothetical protein VFE51_11655 [Verrucomicrobiae bacterium]|nr:hypothetical protein [Verrucomicrobiae bacterium]